MMALAPEPASGLRSGNRNPVNNCPDNISGVNAPHASRRRDNHTMAYDRNGKLLHIVWQNEVPGITIPEKYLPGG